MWKRINILILIMSLILVNIAVASDCVMPNWYDKTFLGETELDCSGIKIIPYITKDIELSSSEFNWVIDENTNSFYPELNNNPILSSVKYPLTEFHYAVTNLETALVCTKVNQFYVSCEKEVLNFNTFETKNNVSYQVCNDINKCNEIGIGEIENNKEKCIPDIQCEIVVNKTIERKEDKDGNLLGYVVSYYGDIINLDPSMDVVYTSSSQLIWENRTEGSSLGARLVASKLFVDFNEDSGTYVQDNSLYNNKGTLTGATYNASCSSGSGGGCYELDGTSSDYIDFGNDNSMDLTTEYTISMWINRITDSGGFERILSKTDKDSAGTPYDWSYYIQIGTDDKISTGCPSSATVTSDLVGATSISTGQWYHVVAIKNATGYAIYLNGEVDATGQTGTMGDCQDNDWKTYIGRMGSNGQWYYGYDGSIDQVQIWDRTLSADEILNLYNGTTNNSDYIGKYFQEGDFKSLVFYNSTSTYWNTTFSMADSTGGLEFDDSDANLVSYWALDGNYLDTMGRNDGTPTGTNNATGISSGAIWFDNVGDEIGVGTWDISGETNLAMSLWVRCQAGSCQGSSSSGMFGLWDGNSGFFLQDNIDAAEGLLCAAGGNNYGKVVTELDDGWHHLVCTYNGSETADADQLKIYKDGVKLTLVFNSDIPTSIPATTSGAFTIGEVTALSRNFYGSIDEVLYYNKSLTSSEVTGLYKAGLSQHANANVTLETRTATSYNVSDANLMGMWGFNNDLNPTIIDQESATMYGAWTLYSAGGYNNNMRYGATGTGADKLKYIFSPTDTGTYDFWTTWLHNANRCPDAPYTVAHDGGSTTVDLDQRTGGDASQRWHLIGSYSLTGGNSYDVNISHDCTGYLSADAVLMVKQENSFQEEKNQFNGICYNETGTNRCPTINDTGFVGNSYKFDGTNDIVQIEYNSAFDITDTLTMSAWVYLDSTISDANARILQKGEGNTAYTLNFANTDDLQVRLYLGSDLVFTIDTDFPEKTWTYVTATYDGNYIRGYENGVLIYTSPDQSSAIGTNTDQLCMGARCDRTATTFFGGMLDEVRIYNKTLTQTEITSLYELGSMHIEWTDWQDEGKMSDGVADTSTGIGNFMQFRANLKTNDTDVSPYVLNYSVTNASEPPPTGDFVVPEFTSGSPHNISVFNNFTGSVLADFNATDDVLFDCFSLNDTSEYNINCSGDITNITGLIVGVDWFNVTINDSSNNKAYGLFYINVSESLIDEPPYFNSSPVYTTYGTNSSGTVFYINTSWNDDIALDYWVLELNQSGTKSNVTVSNVWTTLGDWYIAVANFTINAIVGSDIYYVIYANDTSGYWNQTGYGILTVEDNDAPTWVTIPANASIDYLEAWSGVTFIGNDTDSLPVGYFINDIINFTINQTGYLNWTSQLNASIYIVNVSVNDTVGNVNSTTWKLTVNKIIPDPASYIIISNPLTPVTFGTLTAVTGTNTISQLDSFYKLYRNNTLVSNPDVQTLDAGTYNYTFNSTGNNNYNSTTVSQLLVVNKKDPSIQELFINNSQTNYSNIISGATDNDIYINASISDTVAGAGAYNFTVNLNGTQIINEYFYATSENAYSIQNLSIGYYNVTLNFTGTPNYNSVTIVRWINITTVLPDPPQLTIISPYNGAFSIDNYTSVVYRATSTTTISNASLIVNGVLNQTIHTITSGVLSYFNIYLNEGYYKITVNVSDIYNGINSSSVNFTVDDNPWEVNGSMAFNNILKTFAIRRCER